MNLAAIAIVLRKELVDHFRDRRSLLSGLLMPLLGPLMFAAMFTTIASWSRQEGPLEIPMLGQRNASSLVAFLASHGATIKDAPADYEEQVRDGRLDLVVVVPDEYPGEWRRGTSASVLLVVDNSRNKARSSVRRATRLLQTYGQQMGALRLLARGLSPELAAPMIVREQDLATPEKQAANVLGMVPMFLLIAVFVGGMHLAIDSTAGERERNSLEPLLLNPVPALSIVLGKWLAGVLATWLAVVVTLGGFALAILRVPLQDLGVKVHLGPLELLALLLAVLPLTLFASALQMLLALFSRTFKEAQTYVSLLSFIPMVPATFLLLHPIKSVTWMFLVPSLGQTLLIGDILRGEAGGATGFILAALGAALAAAICLAVTTRLLGSERIVFGR